MKSKNRVRAASTRVVVAALLLFVAALPAAQADCKFKRIATLPIDWVDDRLMLAGSINDTPMQMVVDTGSQLTMVSGALADKLKLPLTHINNVAVGIGGRSEESMSRLDEFSVGRFQWHGFKVGVVWDSGPHMPDVLVGAPVFFQRDVELDGKQLAFFSGTDCADAELGYWADNVPWLPTSQTSPQDLRVNITVQVNGVPLRALVDSGAPTSLLDLQAARRLGFNPDDPATRVGINGGIGAHQTAAFVMTLDSVAFGPEIVRRPRIRVSDLWGSAQHDLRNSEKGDFFDGQPDLILGADFIRSHHLLFANSQHRLYFSYLGGNVFQAPRPAPAASAATSANAASAPAAVH